MYPESPLWFSLFYCETEQIQIQTRNMKFDWHVSRKSLYLSCETEQTQNDEQRNQVTCMCPESFPAPNPQTPGFRPPAEQNLNLLLLKSYHILVFCAFDWRAWNKCMTCKQYFEKSENQFSTKLGRVKYHLNVCYPGEKRVQTQEDQACPKLTSPPPWQPES